MDPYVVVSFFRFIQLYAKQSENSEHRTKAKKQPDHNFGPSG